MSRIEATLQAATRVSSEVPAAPDASGENVSVIEKPLTYTGGESLLGRPSADQLKGHSVRGGAITLIAQATKLLVQTGTMVVLARLLSPEDYGLQGMVVALTGVFALFADIGLGAATVQREAITHEELSAICWINIAVGAAITVLIVVLAPALVTFYHEPRVYWIAIVSAPAFLFTGAAAQHRALLQRTMRYATLAKIELTSLLFSFVVGVGMALYGLGYWSLVGMAICAPIVVSLGSWLSIPWRPSLPNGDVQIRSMLRFGWTVTFNNLVVYVAYNTEKVLLGRSWGTEALGVYGRAYQLLNLPMQQLYTAMYTVAFPALSQIQQDTGRLCRAFLRGYSILLALILPVILAFAINANEVVRLVLGPKWSSAAMLLRLLTPAILVFALINPFGWLLIATGRTVRSLNIALAIAPVVIIGIVTGLPHGPSGVAVGYSVAMLTLLLPLIVWSIYETGISLADYWSAVRKPFVAGALAAIASVLVKETLVADGGPAVRLATSLLVGAAMYAWILLSIMNEKALYVDMVTHLLERWSIGRRWLARARLG